MFPMVLIKKYVEHIYQDLNDTGDALIPTIDCSRNDENMSKLNEFVIETRSIFQHNANIYNEDPIYLESTIGLENILSG